MTTDQEQQRVSLGIKFRVWYQLWEASEGWHAKGRYLRATFSRVPRHAQAAVILGPIVIVATAVALVTAR